MVVPEPSGSGDDTRPAPTCAPEPTVVDATITVTCLSDGRAHSVPDVELATAASRGGGHYRAVCGHLVTAASMVEPDGKPCQECAEAWSPSREHQSRGFSQRLMRR